VTVILSKFVVLEKAMAVDHDLTTTVILNLLKAGGPTTTENSGRQLFSGEIADFSKKHARDLPGIHHLSLADKDAKMKELRLTLPRPVYARDGGVQQADQFQQLGAGRTCLRHPYRSCPLRQCQCQCHGAEYSGRCCRRPVVDFGYHVLQLRHARPLSS
jgi:hypothetical protein